MSHVSRKQAEDVVERQQEDGRGDAYVADPLVLFVERAVSADGAEARFAAYRQLTEHDDRADKDDEKQIDDQECNAAVAAHFVREAPDVSQADRRADGRHQEAKVGSP